MRDEIPTKVSELENDSGYLTEHQSLDQCVKVTGGTMTGTLTAQNGITVSKGELVVGASAALRVNKKTIKSGYGQSEIMVNLPDSSGTLALKSDLDEYAKSEDVPTKVSELENDSGYLTEHQSLAGYLPLSGGTMTGVLRFDTNTVPVIVSKGILQIATQLNNRWCHYSFPTETCKLATDAQIAALRKEKADSEEDGTLLYSGSGVFDEETPTNADDILATPEGGSWTERNNSYRTEYDNDDDEGYYVECTACGSTSKTTLKNLTRAQTVKGKGYLFFRWGDHGQYSDGLNDDEDWYDFWVYDDVTIKDRTKLTIPESISKHTYSKEEVDGKLALTLPLTGGTLTGNVTFSGTNRLVFGSRPRIDSREGGVLSYYYFPETSGTLALDKDVQELKTDKADAEVETVYDHVEAGVFWSGTDITQNDIVVRDEGGEFVDYSNRYSATRLANGYRITCTQYRGSASHLTIRNETKGTSVAGTGSLDFDFGDEGEIFDGDEDWDDIYILQNVDIETGTRKLTVVESIEKRLQGIEEELEDFTDWKESDRTTIGKNAVANDEECVAVGAEAQAKYRSASIGYRAFTSSSYAVAIGNESEARFGAVAVGSSAKGYGNNSTAIGDSSSAGGASSVVVGVGATTSDAATGSVQLGQGTCTTSNTLKFKNTVVVDSGGKIPAGSLSVSEQLGNLEPLPSNASLTDVVTRLNAILAALKG